MTTNISQIYGVIIEVSKNHVDKVKAADDYKFLSSKGTKVTFTTEVLTRLNEESRNLDEEYKKKQEEIVQKMFKVISTYYPVM